MSWRIRHAGSPQQVGNLTLAQIVGGLQDGEWDIDDEVMGPSDRQWVTIGDHPALEDVVEAIEIAAANEDKVVHDPEEDRIDMNPLIDVCLVLLVFFILATTMAVMEKVLRIPEAKQAAPGAIAISEDKVKETMLIVKATMKDNKPQINLEEKEVTPDQLLVRLRNARSETGKTQLVIDAKDVDWQTVVAIIDAASGAGINKVAFKVDAPAAKPGQPAGIPK